MTEQISSYLKSLKFDPKLWNTLQAKYLLNFRLVILFIISIVLIGIFNFISIPRRSNPEVKIAIVTVVTALPGANPTDVESLVTTPIEDKLNGVKGLDTMTSVSSEGVSAITLQFLSTVDPDKAKQDVQSLVDSVNTLPTDAKTPAVNKLDFENEPIWDFIITGKNMDAPSINRFATILKDRIKAVQKVDHVDIQGYDNQEIDVIIDPVKLREYNLTPQQLSTLISRATSSYPAGSLSVNSSTLSLSINQQIVTLEDIRNMHLSSQGQVLKLSDVATVQERSKLHQQQTFYAPKNGLIQNAVEVFVYKTSSANIDAAEKDVKKVVNETLNEYGNRFELVTVLSAAEEITKQFTDLVDEFRSTIILVFINLLLFLGLRQAFISSLTIPLTFLSAISIMNILGLTLNFLTLFAFLIALGLLIDDTIVTVAAMTRYYSTGKFTPQETGLLVWKDFIVPLWSTTITTIWAFVPLLLAGGIIGEFIKSIPIVVTATMLSSTTIAVLITLPLLMVFLKPQLPSRVIILLRVIGIIVALLFIYLLLPKTPLLPLIFIVGALLVFTAFRVRSTLYNNVRTSIGEQPFIKRWGPFARHIVNHGLINTEVLSYHYMRFIRRILNSTSARRKTILIIVIFALVSYLLVPLGFVVNEFFPKSDQDLIYVGVELPAGTSIESGRVEALSLLKQLNATPELKFIVASTGSAVAANFNRANNTNNFLLTLHLLPKEERHISSSDIAEQIRKKFANYDRGTLSVTELSGGPPAGADVQIKLLGDNLTVLDTYADKIAAFLKTQPGITNVTKSIKSGTSRLVFVPDKLKLAENGLTVDGVSTWLRTYASGFTLDSIKIENTDTDIVFRMGTTDLTPELLSTISIPVQSQIPAPQGSAIGTAPSTVSSATTVTSVPLLSLGTFQLQTNPTSITHEKQKRTISVSASVVKGFSTTQKNQDLLKYAQTLNLPNGYTWATGGVNEENQKSIQSIFQAMILSFLLISVTMVIEFRSFRQALLVMLVIPLAIPGVFYIFALFGIPLSFPALIGVLALFGIVVTNAIVVVEKINDNRKEGMPLKEAIIDASGSRLEPILLTSITSILGLIPVTISDPLWRGLGGAIIAGLLFSGMIKLFFVPLVYYSWYRSEEKTEKNGANFTELRVK
jgi:multidrug efflux pump subunit AcrB